MLNCKCGIFIVGIYLKKKKKRAQNLLKLLFGFHIPSFQCALMRVYRWQFLVTHFGKVEVCLTILKVLLTWILLEKIATFLMLECHLYLEGSDKVVVVFFNTFPFHITDRHWSVIEHCKGALMSDNIHETTCSVGTYKISILQDGAIVNGCTLWSSNCFLKHVPHVFCVLPSHLHRHCVNEVWVKLLYSFFFFF